MSKETEHEHLDPQSALRRLVSLQVEQQTRLDKMEPVLMLGACLALIAINTVDLACAPADAAPPKPGLTIGSNHSPARRLGVPLNDAGVPIDDAGAVSFYLDGGITPPFGDPVIDHCVVTSYSGDFATQTITARVVCGGTHTQNVTVQLTGAQNGAILNLVKTQAAAQMQVGFQ